MELWAQISVEGNVEQTSRSDEELPFLKGGTLTKLVGDAMGDAIVSSNFSDAIRYELYCSYRA